MKASNFSTSGTSIVHFCSFLLEVNEKKIALSLMEVQVCVSG